MLAEIVNGGLVLLLVLCAFWVDEPGEGTILLPVGAEYLVLATPLALIAFIGVVARPVAGLLDLLLRRRTLRRRCGGARFRKVSGFGTSAAGRGIPGQRFPETDWGWCRQPHRQDAVTFKGPRPRFELAGLPVPSESVIDLVRRLRAADLAATAETLELALATRETIPGASSPDRFALVVPDREALLRVLDEECPAELTELMSLLRADHEWRVRRGIWVDPRSRSGVGDT